MYADITVVIQFIALGILLFTGPVLPRQVVALYLVLAGVVLGFWAIWVMRRSVFRISPDVAPGAKLVTDGPYAVVRHPMYTAVLLTAIGWVVGYATPLRIAAFFVLAVDLLWKISYEEGQLRKHFKAYAAYARKTSRLLPWLF